MAASETRVAEADLSFERLYRTHRRDVYNFVLHDVRNPDEAEDVTQVAFLNAYRALRNGHPPERPRAWLLTIARNVARRRFRKRASSIREVPLDTELAVAAPDDYDGPTADEICAAFRELPEKQRAALAMREIQGRSYAEIATELKLSTAAVETLIFRARRSLRALLEPEESRLGSVLLLPLALPGLIGKALSSVAASVGRTGLAGRTAGLVGAIVVGTGAVVELVPPLIAADLPPAARVVPSGQFAERSVTPPATDAGIAAGQASAKAKKKGAGATGTADAADAAVLPELPQVSLPTAPEATLPTVPEVTLPSLEVPQLPQVEVPEVPLPPVPELPSLD